MAIGTSKGQYFEDAEQFHLAHYVTPTTPTPNTNNSPTVTSEAPSPIVEGEQYAMNVRKNPADPSKPGRDLDIPGGGQPAVSVRQQPMEPPRELGDALTSYSKGTMKSQDVQKIFKERGWSVNMRKGNYDFEVVGPDGRYQYITP